MQGVLMPPVGVGGQRQHADDAAETVVGTAGLKERAVAAIMLNDEQANQEPRRGNRKQQSQPVADAKGKPHRQPERRKLQGQHKLFGHVPIVNQLKIRQQPNSGQNQCDGESKPAPHKFHTQNDRARHSRK